ncbi:MAG: ribonuclease HII, partial [Chloroflexi bacterium]|nr:ribonuclease HII [Chloroflexota bacterium]
MPPDRTTHRPAAQPRTPPVRDREKGLLLSGAKVVAGVDEAGRGALAGPVVAAAVVLHAERCPDGLDDSKRLLPGVRQALYHEILHTADAVAVHMTGPQRIDRINILRASHEALRGAVRALCLPDAVALVD